MIDFADHFPVGGCFISVDRNRAVQSHTLNCFVQKGFCSLRIASFCEPEIYQLAVGINCAPQVTPFATNTSVRLIR